MRKSLLVAAVLASVSSQVGAQQSKPIELGLDAQLSYSTEAPHSTTITAPVGRIRAGFVVSPSLTLEPTAALQHFSGLGLSSTSYTLGTGLLYHFNSDRSVAQPYVRPFVEYSRLSGSNFQGSGNTSVGAGLGVKIPVMDRFKWRLEGGFAAASHSNSRVFVLAGFSIFTH